VWGQQSQAQEFTQRQNNGQHTYNRAPHLRPDRFRDTLLHNHGLDAAGAVDEDGNPMAMRYAGSPKSDNFFVALLALIGFFLSIPVILTISWYAGAGLYFTYGVNIWLSLIAGIAALIGTPWFTRWVFFSGKNLKARGSLWRIPFGLVALALAFGVPAYFGATWTWASFDFLQLAMPDTTRLYAGLGTAGFYGLAVYTTLRSSR
tara:strand:+ start:40 stop:651 length:612 start_codon:yes stop_codon:yes gene_type:complete